MEPTKHIPVLAQEVAEVLSPPFMQWQGARPPVLLDCTWGGGGHSRAILEKLVDKPIRILGLDRDPEAIVRGRAAFRAELENGRVEIHHLPFSRFEEVLGDAPLLGLIADLGFSSDQLENTGRGLSFQGEGPLDMRLDPSRGPTCEDLLRTLCERELARILSEYGEEPFAEQIARALVQSREQGELPRTTRALAKLIVHAVPPRARHARIHVATRSFQALRIAVNDELAELNVLLRHAILKLKPGGRAAFISFHSLEDRMIKRYLRELVPIEKGATKEFRLLSKKPLRPRIEEVRRNPRARSAKLRVIEKL